MTPKRKETRQRVAETNIPRRAWSIVEVAAQLGRSYDAVSEMLRNGELGWVPAGKSKLIPAEELDRYLADIRHGDVA